MPGDTMSPDRAESALPAHAEVPLGGEAMQRVVVAHGEGYRLRAKPSCLYHLATPSDSLTMPSAKYSATVAAQFKNQRLLGR